MSARPPLRILLCTPRFAPQLGGAETWTAQVSRSLVALGHRVAVIAGSARGIARREESEGIRVRRFGGGRVGLALGMASVIRRAKPDAVLAQYSALPAAVLASRARIPVLGIVHDVYGFRESVRVRGPFTGPVRYVGLEASLHLMTPQAFLVPSKTTATNLARIAPRTAITVVPPGSDHVREDGTAERDRTQVVFVGRLVRQKGVDDLIQAVRLLRGRDIPCRAVIVGRGPEERRLRRLSRDLEETVVFTGRLDDAALDTVVRRSSVLVLPSSREGWGLAITEAARRGIPYVAYDLPSVREQHLRLQGGILVPPDPHPLADALEGLLRDPQVAVSYGARGRAAAAGMRWIDAARIVELAVEDQVRGRSRGGRGDL